MPSVPYFRASRKHRKSPSVTAWARLLSLLVVPVALLAGLPQQALAVGTATSANALACDLSPASNSGYLTWWQQVSTNATYQNWFWNDIVPNQTSACRKDVAATLWTKAVPGNWVSVNNIGGWPWATGGYFTQTLWLRAIPNNWASVADIGGWPWDWGGYYTQYFWLHAVPDGIAPIAATSGWVGTSGGYYAQWLWLHAVPENWASVQNIDDWPWATGGYYTQWVWLHAIADDWAPVPDMGGWNDKTGGGYYAQFFWLHAVPDGLRPVANLGGWPASTGGYYAQWLWLRAIPGNWAPADSFDSWPWDGGGYFAQWFWLDAVPDALARSTTHPSGYYDDVFWTQAVPQQWDRQANYAVGGAANSGYFYYWLYRFGTTSGIAPRANQALYGDTTVGYYAAQLQGPHHTDPGITPLWTLATGYLPASVTARPVNEWYRSDAHAVVIFSFDSEGDQSQNCAVRDVLNKHHATATFNVVGYSIAGIKSCLTGFDVQNHTADHPPSVDQWDAPGLFATLSNAQQLSEIQGNTAKLKAAFPNATVNAFRTPWCDSEKSFDGSVAHNLIASNIVSDSSVPMTMPAAAQTTPIPAALRNFSLSNAPSPFVARTEGTKNLVEFPFAYPSDYEAMANGLNVNIGDPSGTNAGTAVHLWKSVFDQIYAANGTMVMLMHPWIQTDAMGQTLALDDLLTYMQSKQGVYFSNMSEAGAKVRAYYHW